MPFSSLPPHNIDRTSLLHQGTTSEKLEILYADSEADLQNGYVIYRGGVKAIYGPTKLSTDTLVVRKGTAGDLPIEVEIDGKKLNLRPFEAYAIGKVSIVDPDGTISASNLWFTWDDARRNLEQEVVGTAEDVEVHVSTVWIKADKMEQSKSGIDLQKVAISTGGWNHPLYQFNAKSIFVIPGKRATAKSVELTVLGVRLPAVPQFLFSLDPRASGVQIPRIGFRQGAGIGMSWGGDYLVNDSTDVSAAVNAYPKVLPTYSVAYGRSAVPVEQAGLNQFAISDQFGERSIFSFFGNIYTQRIEDAYDRIRIPKNLFSVGSSFNFETSSRITDRKTNYSRPLEIGYERGGPMGTWGYLVQAKASRISESQGGGSANRLALQANVFTPLAKFGRVTAGTRIDGLYRLDSSPSGYFGAEGGLTYSALDNLRFSGGAYGYYNFGTPLFDGDNFSTNQGFVVRGDWFGAATNISLMYRYDPTQGWFDREYRISQVMGSIEPVIIYRESPRHYQLGIRFRTQDIVKLLQRRKLNRDTNKGTEDKAGDRQAEGTN